MSDLPMNLISKTENEKGKHACASQEEYPDVPMMISYTRLFV
jgi:hypothetical protein